MSAPPPLLTTADELAALAGEMRARGRFAIDTEFVWERTYRPVLGVVQVATDERVAVIDALAVPDLAPLFPLLRDPAVPVVLQGGGQDLEIFASLMGAPVRGVVDTQLVAAFLGYGLQVGLGMLLERVLKVHIRKDQTYTNWTRRPLRPEQLDYAREDVVHLLPLYDRLRADLERRGRMAWVEEELRALEEASRFAALPDEERWRTVKGWQRLGARELAVLRELAAWRERSAARANIRPNFIANDIVLISLAARPPAGVEELRQMRGLTPGTVERHGKGILGAIRAGLACPPERRPAPPPRHRRKGPPPGLVALLRAAVQAVAEREDIASEVIAPSRDIDALAAWAVNGNGLDDVALVRGWRRTLVGETLLAIARGELAMRYDAARREVVADAVARRR
ncbi:MAG TPA: ribonuclease D [Candidatus Limnocylindria bacterium]|nr:ribonuclease D [Candidatus Limnocylindria bacterium]